MSHKNRSQNTAKNVKNSPQFPNEYIYSVCGDNLLVSEAFVFITRAKYEIIVVNFS